MTGRIEVERVQQQHLTRFERENENPPIDILQEYFQEISVYPLLTAEQEVLLGTHIQQAVKIQSAHPEENPTFTSEELHYLEVGEEAKKNDNTE